MISPIQKPITNLFTNKLPLAVILLLTAIYFANCFTPLRLTNDTVRYINIKEWIEAGKPAGDKASTEFLPYGYVWFLMLLSKLHIAKSVFISLIQLSYLLGSLWFIKKIFGTTIRFWQLLALCMLNWATLKFVITPLSEMQFIFFSMGALFYFTEFEKKKKLVHLAGIIIFSTAAILTRTIGFILIITFIVTLLIKYRKPLRNAMVANKWIVLVIIAVLILPFFFIDTLGISDYLKSHSWYFRKLWDNPIFFVANNLKFHLIDWSALFLNSPAPKLEFLGTTAIRNTLYLIAGILGFGWIVYILFRRNGNIPVLIVVYLICYIGVILNWPLFEPRLWVPAMPLFIALILQQPIKRRLIRLAASAYVAIYIVTGIAAIAYYTYTSFDKKALAVKQDAGKWKKEYETHFFGQPMNDTTVVKERIVGILKKYD